MKITKKTLASLLAGALLFFGREGKAQERQEYIISSLTNNTTVSWVNSDGWQPQYKVLATAGNNGQVQYEQGDNNFYDEGTNLVLHAIPDQYHNFSNWTGQINSTNNPLELIVNQPYTNLVANFVPGETSQGTPITWYFQFGITNNFNFYDSNDTDNDGKTGREEYFWGTNPTNHLSYPRVELIRSNNNFYLIIPETYQGRNYTIEKKTHSLQNPNWTELTNFSGINGPLTISLNTTNLTEFYRGRARVEE